MGLGKVVQSLETDKISEGYRSGIIDTQSSLLYLSISWHTSRHQLVLGCLQCFVQPCCQGFRLHSQVIQTHWQNFCKIRCQIFIWRVQCDWLYTLLHLNWLLVHAVSWLSHVVMITLNTSSEHILDIQIVKIQPLIFSSLVYWFLLASDSPWKIRATFTKSQDPFVPIQNEHLHTWLHLCTHIQGKLCTCKCLFAHNCPVCANNK